MISTSTQSLGAALDDRGYAVIRSLLTDADCHQMRAMFSDPQAHFRSTVVMSRHGFGEGEYKYLARPLPAMVQNLRETLYEALCPIANEWAERLAITHRWPDRHADFVNRCAAAGQTKPTPLLLRYGAGDYNRLHQDLYGTIYFPLQIVALLNAPQYDFTGGELMLVESRARMQSRPILVPLQLGDAAIIPVRERPIRSVRGWSKATMRHGVAEIHTGTRHTLGVIFHDAA